MKIVFLLLILCHLIFTKKIERIIRKHYDLPLVYRGEDFKKLATDIFDKIEDEMQFLQNS